MFRLGLLLPVMMMPEWCDTPMDMMTDYTPSMMMTSMPTMHMSVDVVDMPPTAPMKMKMKPAKADASGLMMAAMMKKAMQMAHEIADNKMKMHMQMHKMEEKPAPTTKKPMAPAQPPCEMEEQMKQQPMAMMMPAKPKQMTGPEMQGKPERMSEPLMVMPSPMMMQMPAMMNNAFPQNLMAGAPMDRRA